MIPTKELDLKHCALVSFAAGLNSLTTMRWAASLEVTRVLARTGKYTKDLTLLEVMRAIQEVEAAAGREVTLPAVDLHMQALRRVVG